jgi:hypothetical protein
VPAAARRVQRPNPAVPELPGVDWGGAAAARGARPRPARRPAGARQDMLAQIIAAELGVGIRLTSGLSGRCCVDVAARLEGLTGGHPQPAPSSNQAGGRRPSPRRCAVIGYLALASLNADGRLP